MDAEMYTRSRWDISNRVISREAIMLAGTLNVVRLENRPAAFRGIVYGRGRREEDGEQYEKTVRCHLDGIE